jgi:hypothetical protein
VSKGNSEGKEDVESKADVDSKEDVDIEIKEEGAESNKVDAKDKNNHLINGVGLGSHDNEAHLAACNTQIEEMPKNLDRFLQVMEEFCISANNRFEELEALYVNVDVKWKETMLYYGENPKIMRPFEFFNIFSQFLQSWKTASIEELRYIEQLEREEKKKREIEQKKLALLKPSIIEAIEESPSSPTDKVGNDRRIMDDLMEQLRSGKVENKVRQRRRVREIKNMKSTEEHRKSRLERKRLSYLSIKMDRRDSASSSTSLMPAISAEELLRSLMLEED